MSISRFSSSEQRRRIRAIGQARLRTVAEAKRSGVDCNCMIGIWRMGLDCLEADHSARMGNVDVQVTQDGGREIVVHLMERVCFVGELVYLD
jgi:hypothetical protein